jgi:serine/threonine protein kinase
MNAAASTVLMSKHGDSKHHHHVPPHQRLQMKDTIPSNVDQASWTPLPDRREVQLEGCTIPSTKKSRLPLQENCHANEIQEEHRPTEEFDVEGNVVKVENLIFIEGILGQGSFGTVRLARRKISNNNNQHLSHAGNSSNSSSGPNSVANTLARKISDVQLASPPFPAPHDEILHGSHRRHLSKSTTEPLKNTFFPECSSSDSKGRHAPDSHLTPKPQEFDGASEAISQMTSSNSRLDNATLTPLSTTLENTSRRRHDRVHHRTISTPIGHRCRGRRFQTHHNYHHAKHTPSMIGNLGFFSRPRSSSNCSDQYCQYDDDEQLVAVKIFSKSFLKRKRTMERDKTTKRLKIKTAWQQVEHEIALMKKLSHPNIVQMYEVIDSPGSDMLYMVLEYMPGGEIMTYQDDGTFRRKNPRAADASYKHIDGVVDGHFDEDQAALYFVDILHGLAYLHQHHICHRDLKPESKWMVRGLFPFDAFGGA